MLVYLIQIQITQYISIAQSLHSILRKLIYLECQYTQNNLVFVWLGHVHRVPVVRISNNPHF